jgi:exopolysaccharide/PEP-CTERM locus tyrosine autokinase
MSNTIEKALQRKKEAEQAAANNEADPSIENTTSKEIPSEIDLEQANDTSEVTESAVKGEEALTPPPSRPRMRKTFDINIPNLEQSGFVTLHTARTQINEEYREIKRKLLANAFGALAQTINNSNIIMVTSARPSEGKTFTAVNLAMSIAAEQDKRVLLVDADVLKPNVLKTLGLNERSGLIEYLLGEVTELGDVMYHTNIDKLTIIPAGRSHHLSTELLASKVMQDTINEFSNRYPDRVVIIDTPPIIGINESAILANFAGQAVVVVEENRSRLSDLQRAVERLNPEMAIGFVVNKSLNSSESVGYYGYHYYGYGKGK